MNYLKQLPIAARPGLCIAILGVLICGLLVDRDDAIEAKDAELALIRSLTLDCSALTESSGICVGKSGVIWTHNDSGAEPVIYGFDQHGKLLGVVSIVNAKAIDWEDICAFEIDSQAYLAIADVGDNNLARIETQIYVIEEPQLESDSPSPSVTKAAIRSQVNVRYAGGPVNCESIAYDPLRKSFLLPSKEPLRCQLFEVDAAGLGKRKLQVTANSLGTAFIPLVTGADISQDGQRLVLCTYGPGGLINRDKTPLQWDAAGVELFALPGRKQGEAVCFDPTSTQIYLTSEFAPTPLLLLKLPDAPPAVTPESGQ